MAVQAFPHPLARLNAIKDTRAAGYRNYLSYMAVDEFTYTGMPPPPLPSCLCPSQVCRWSVPKTLAASSLGQVNWDDASNAVRLTAVSMTCNTVSVAAARFCNLCL